MTKKWHLGTNRVPKDRVQFAIESKMHTLVTEQFLATIAAVAGNCELAPESPLTWKTSIRNF